MARTPQQLPCLPLRDNPTGTSLILVTFALLALGVVLVWTSLASLKTPGAWYARVDVRHIAYALLAAVVLSIAWRFDYRRLLGANGSIWPAAVLLGVSLFLGVLVWAPGIGYSVGGFHRWVRFGTGSFNIQFQPSEVIKLSLLVFLAAWLSRDNVNVRSIKTFVSAGVIILACVGMIITQDFGTAAIVGFSAAITLLLAGVPWYYLCSFIPPAGGAFYFLVYLNDYRWTRVMAMMNPWSEENYQTRQALIAICSGGWEGKGLGYGISKLGYLPERSTDYIFAILCHEMGFLGAALLIGLLIVWIWQSRKAAMRSCDRFGQLLVGALSFVIVVQAMMHIAVNLAVFPPKGIGLPFVSAGGTSLIIMAAAVSLIISVTSRSQTQDLTQASLASV